jgi:hypothetical protein
MKRRNLLIAAGGMALVAGSARASEEDEQVEFLFVQTAPSVKLSGGKLTMTGANPHTLYFSDRPERIFGRVTTKEFVDMWGQGIDSFKSDPPNAVLTVHNHDDPSEVVVVLRDPRMEGADLVYDVEVLDGRDEVMGPTASLFIDTIGRPLTPMSVAGVRRRTRRRTRRRNN